MAVATESSWKYKPGQVVVTALPLVYSLSLESTKFCAGCFKQPPEGPDGQEEPLKACANCRHFKYCSRKCQTDDWKKFHKLGECKIYTKNGGEIKSNFARFALRLLLLHQRQPEQLKKLVTLIDGTGRTLQDLKDHFDEIKNDEIRVKSFVATFSLFKSLGLKLETEEVFRIFCKLCINSFSILDTSLNEIGTGLYIETSIFDHSCQPNAAPVFDGLKIEIRTLKNVPLDEALTINYVDIKEARSSRRAKLMAQYYFTCQCPRCTKDDEGVGEEESISHEIAKMDKKCDELINTHGDEAPWNECYLLLIQTLPLYESIYGQYHPDLSVQLMRCLKARSNINFVDGSDALAVLASKASQAIQVTHGIEHPLYKEFEESFVSY